MLRQSTRKFIATALAALCIFNSSPTQAFAKTSLEIANEHGANLNSNYQPEGSIIADDKTGRILWSENIHTQWTPASMSKLMVILLAYEKIDEGKLSLDTEVPVTDEVIKLCRNNMLANNNMKEGASYTVSELIDLVIVPSSAAATYMLADCVNPDRAELVRMMNAKAQELHMNDTKYQNPVGVRNKLLGFLMPEGADPEGDNYTSAHDYAVLAGELINKHPDILNHTHSFKIVVKEGTPYEEHFEGYVHSLPGARYEYEGTDGLKSGSADKGYNYTSTCKRGETRLNLIILGVGWWDLDDAEWQRHLIGNALYDEAFDTYEYRQILQRGSTYTVGEKSYVAQEDLWDCVRKDFTIDQLVVDESKGIAYANTDTPFLAGYEVPTARVTSNSNLFGSSTEVDTKEGLATFAVSLFAAGAIITMIKLASKKKRKKTQASAPIVTPTPQSSSGSAAPATAKSAPSHGKHFK